MNAQVKFPSPYDLKAPEGAEGWRDLYPYYTLFQEERKQERRKAVSGSATRSTGRRRSGRSTPSWWISRSSDWANTTRVTSWCRRPMASITGSTMATSI